MTQNIGKGPSDYEALAAKCLDLWQEQIAKLAKDPRQLTDAAAAWSRTATSMMQNAASAMGGTAIVMSPTAEPHDAPDSHIKTTATPGAKTTRSSYGDGGLDSADVLRRLDALEKRLAILEPKPTKSDLNHRSPSRRKKPENLKGTWADYLEPAPFLEVVTRGAQNRLQGFVAGVKAYQDHPYSRSVQPPPSI